MADKESSGVFGGICLQSQPITIDRALYISLIFICLRSP